MLSVFDFVIICWFVLDFGKVFVYNGCFVFVCVLCRMFVNLVYVMFVW